MGKRIAYLDTAKGIAMLAIVLGHLNFVGPLTGRGTLTSFVFQFHVPLFFLLAGYTLSKRQTIGEFVVAKARRLLLPYVAICAAMVPVLLLLRVTRGTVNPPSQFPGIWSFVIAALKGTGSFSLPLGPEGTIIGAIWFLEALFVALVEVRICIEWERVAPVVVAALFALAIKTCHTFYIPGNVQQGFIAGLYVYLGYLARKVGLLERAPQPAAAAVLAAISAVALWRVVNVSLVRGYLGPHCLGFPVSLSTSLLVVWVARWISERLPGLHRFLVAVSDYSLVILGVHIIALDCGLAWVLSALGLPEGGNLIPAVSLALQAVACLGAALVVSRVPALRGVFGTPDPSRGRAK